MHVTVSLDTSVFTRNSLSDVQRLVVLHDDRKRFSTGTSGGKRSINGQIGLKVPVEVVKTRCQPDMARGKPVHRPERLNDSEVSIVETYQAEFRGLAQYYQLAVNRSRLDTLRWIMEQSLTKTLAAKRRVLRVPGAKVIRSRVMATDAVSTVRAWHEALNTGDVEELIALSSDEIELGGPRGRGTGPGAQLLRDWFERAGIHLEPYQTFHRDSTVVVEQGASWQRPGPGTTTEPQPVASVFIVKDGRVASVVRYADLASALEASGLTYSDKV